MTTTIDPSAVIGRAFGIYREHAATLMPAAAAVFVIDAAARILLDSGVLLLLASLLSLVLHFFYQGMVVRLVGEVREGSSGSSVGALLSGVAPVALPLAVACLLAGIGIVVGLVFLIVPGLFLLAIWAVVAPVVVLEGKEPIAALERSRELVRGNVLGALAVALFSFLLLALAVSVAGLLGDAIAGGVGIAVLGFVASVAVAPVGALAVSVLYFTLRDGYA